MNFENSHNNPVELGLDINRQSRERRGRGGAQAARFATIAAAYHNGKGQEYGINPQEIVGSI